MKQEGYTTLAIEHERDFPAVRYTAAYEPPTGPLILFCTSSGYSPVTLYLTEEAETALLALLQKRAAEGKHAE